MAQSYINSGCDMISVLTDESFFWGSPSYVWEIRNNLGSKFPLLMKDFILEPIQVYLAKVLGASHYLLIVKALSEEKLSELFHLGLSIGLTPLVEVHNRKEAEVALKLEPSLLGVNHRNLEDFSINLNLTEEIIDLVPQKTILIAESGINSIETCKDLLSKGLGGFLIGEWLNKANKPGEIVKKIKSLNGF